MTMIDHMPSQPLWLVGIMIGIHIVAVPLTIKDWRPRVILMILIAIFMLALFSKFGYTRIFGLSHVVIWTSLLAYLWRSRNNHPERVWIGRFVKLSMANIFISPLFDYADVAQYVSGDRAVMGG